MKRILEALSLLLLLSGVASAQEATLNTPVTPPAEAKYTVSSLFLNANGAVIVVEVKTSGNAVVRTFNVDVPSAAHPSATVPGIFSALDTAVPGETGGILRRANARLLKFAIDNGYLPGVTLVP